MPIAYTPEQEKIMTKAEERNNASGVVDYSDCDASQAAMQVLDLQEFEEIGEHVYRVILRDPLNLKKPVAMYIHVFAKDGTVQAMEENHEEVLESWQDEFDLEQW